MAISLQRMNAASVKPGQRVAPVRIGRPVVKVAVLADDTSNPFDPSTWRDGAENEKDKKYPTGQAAMRQWEVPPNLSRGGETSDAPWVEMAGDGTEDSRERKSDIPRGPGKYTSKNEEDKDINEGPNRGR